MELANGRLTRDDFFFLSSGFDMKVLRFKERLVNGEEIHQKLLVTETSF